MEFQETYFGSIPGTSDNDTTLVQLRIKIIVKL